MSLKLNDIILKRKINIKINKRNKTNIKKNLGYKLNNYLIYNKILRQFGFLDTIITKF